MEKNVLTVGAERSPSWGADAELLVAERPQGAFTRQLFLAETLLDAGKVEATYDAGVLTVSIPVAEAAEPRRVEIGGSGNGKATPTRRPPRPAEQEVHPFERESRCQPARFAHENTGEGPRLTTPPGAVRLPHRARPRN